MAAQRTMTYGVVVGNRGFFPDHLAKTGREEMIAAIEADGGKAIVLSPQESKFGAVETFAEAQQCADLFKKHAGEIDGIIVTLPNFGDERGVADALRLSGLKVPVLVQATPDKSDAMTIATRRDSFCGKMSACNNLMQYGIPYSLTTLHTEAPASAEFKADLEWFGAVCRIVDGLKNLRIGSIGARPQAFNTVRYSERILETSGISVIPIDLSEILGRINKMGDMDDAALFAEVGQRDDDAVDLFGMLLEKLRALLRFGVGFHGAVLRIFGAEHDRLRACCFQNGDDFFTASLGQMVGKIAAVPDDNPKGHGALR